MRYAPNSRRRLDVRWQPPGGEWEPIPLSALYNPALPDVGLIGSYYAGEGFQGPTLAVRKDFILGAEADLPRPYSVRWQGKLAVPRAGEHLFAVTSNGAVHFAVDGRELLVYAPEALDPGAPAYTQAGVYLSQGWRDLEIRYTPADDRPNLRILWQPPGSSPALLFSRYLRPALGELYPGDAPLPSAPDLIDPRLGDDAFALSYVSELAQPQTVLPPADLPPLLLEEVWRVDGGCGAGAGQLNAPHGVALDASAGRVYVADTGNRRISPMIWFQAPAGVYGEGLRGGGGPGCRPAGELIALDAVAQQLVRIDTATGELAPLTLDTSFYRPRPCRRRGGTDSGSRHRRGRGAAGQHRANTRPVRRRRHRAGQRPAGGRCSRAGRCGPSPRGRAAVAATIWRALRPSAPTPSTARTWPACPTAATSHRPGGGRSPLPRGKRPTAAPVRLSGPLANPSASPCGIRRPGLPGCERQRNLYALRVAGAAAGLRR